MEKNRYVGRLVSASKARKYGFIGINTVHGEAGIEPALPTTADIYIHSSDCSQPLREGMKISFTVTEDAKRGEGFLRVRDAKETDMSRIELIARGGIELSFRGDEGHCLAQASTFVSWCISAELAGQVKAKLLESENRVFQLLLVWWPAGRRQPSREQRMLVNLDDPMAVMKFRASGRHRVVALLAYTRSKVDLENLYLNRIGGEYTTDIIGTDGCWIVLEQGTRYLGSGVVEVDIPQRLFADKPRGWNLVNKFYKDPPRDQCAFRRRCLLIPITLIFNGVYYGCVGGCKWLASLAFVALLLSFGVQGIKYRPLRHPIECEVLDIFGDTINDLSSVFAPKFGRHYILVPFVASPFVLAIAAVIGMIISEKTGDASVWLPVFSAVMFGAFCILTLLTALASSGGEVEQEQAKHQEADERKRRVVARVDHLICASTTPRTPDPWTLRPSVKTFRFIALALKQKVCKPFAA